MGDIYINPGTFTRSPNPQLTEYDFLIKFLALGKKFLNHMLYTPILKLIRITNK